MHAKIYPGAIQRRYSGVSGLAQPTISKLVLHSTETPGGNCPGYSGGTNAPTLTLDPWNGTIWQHFDANESAKALMDPSSTSVRENRDNVAQLEILGYSDLNHAAKYGFDLRNIGDRGVARIAAVIAWYHAEWEVPLIAAAPWPMYPASYGNTSARMAGSTYDRFEGVLGHLHVPGNSHGDPSIPIAKIIAAAGQPAGASGAKPLAPDTTEEIDMDTAAALRAEIAQLRAVVDARTSPKIPGTRIEQMSAQLQNVPSRSGPVSPDVARRRGVSGYEQAADLRQAVAALATQLAELRDLPSDEIRQAIAEAGDALARAAAELKES